METPQAIAALSRSGFPFQTAVAATLRATNLFSIEEEVAWEGRDGATGFLDIVASNAKVHIVVECKALRKESLIFLLPKDTVAPQTARIDAIMLSHVTSDLVRPRVAYGECYGKPESFESMYCVIRGSDKGGRIIERDIQPLIQGIERYAIDRIRAFRKGEPII